MVGHTESGPNLLCAFIAVVLLDDWAAVTVAISAVAPLGVRMGRPSECVGEFAGYMIPPQPCPARLSEVERPFEACHCAAHVAGREPCETGIEGCRIERDTAEPDHRRRAGTRRLHGDGVTEIAVFRPSVGGWYVDGAAPVFYGLSTDVPVPDDYDGDGTTEPRCTDRSSGAGTCRTKRPSSTGWVQTSRCRTLKPRHDRCSPASSLPVCSAGDSGLIDRSSIADDLAVIASAVPPGVKSHNTRAAAGCGSSPTRWWDSRTRALHEPTRPTTYRGART